MTRPLQPDETRLLDQLADGHTLGQLTSRSPSDAADIRRTAARARRALGARTLDHAVQIHRTQDQP
ncbi:hypothetical protein [Kitasatospora fiedleri]|uniref:hypothetical protein n=1 Tax=Kitasatospora fiedleri TaxID=2991545 RepID=UPI00249BC90B|nr:hypothetical protein [Kitasatospora fiedleri]